MKHNHPGFTLTELLVVMGIMGVLAAVSWPTLASMKKSADTKDSVDQVISVLRQAQAQAISGQGDQVVTFSGTEPCAITTPSLGTVTAPPGVTCCKHGSPGTTPDPVTFTKLSGKVTAGSAIVFDVNTKTVTISSPIGLITSS